MNKLRNILLLPNAKKKISPESLSALFTVLFQHGCTVSVLADAAEQLAGFHVSVTDGRDGFSGYDCALVLGGDGSILVASAKVRDAGIPLIGINFGHVGFLTALDEDEIANLGALLDGDYTIDERMMLDATIRTATGEEREHFTVLNDAVLTSGPIASLISFDVYADGMKLESVRADGLITATPTGSTAYSLSAGGPVLDPSLDAICLTPICPHTLTSRPIIFRAETELTICDIRVRKSTAYFSADGCDVVDLHEGDTVTIQKSSCRLKLIRVKKSGFISVLHAKLSDNEHYSAD